VLAADDLKKMQSWVDSTYAVHPDMKSHTGGVSSFGNGGLLAKLSKQKLNTKSSTEAKLVGASDYLPHTVWIKMFMEAQGHTMSEYTMEQDNESAIKLEMSERSSAGPKSRHLDIRYFWIKDITKRNDIKISHCPTLCMLAHFLTKPLEGLLFQTFRDALLGNQHVHTLLEAPATQSKEHVGEMRTVTGSGNEWVHEQESVGEERRDMPHRQPDKPVNEKVSTVLYR
jgi:hypothetical protein